MVYESDFYTTRRPYSRPNVSSYTTTRNEVPWEKVPYVPRPSLIADPVTAFGKKKPKHEERKSILDPINRAAIKPKESLLRPLQPYVSAREKTRESVLREMKRQEGLREAGGSLAASTDPRSMDSILPRLHYTTDSKTSHRKIFFVAPKY
ncbi:uncharacterized protein CG45078 [Phlebotomus papatasi]|uniref:uncharacterized protein CG45078 n=1 Tax=Phlebotomus papatasi TaxID=29031 RepID=UPI00248363AA|nr:uncharacterized protein CG45078 [Phlebotomus papatasi]